MDLSKILKSRDITLTIKVFIIKDMVLTNGSETDLLESLTNEKMNTFKLGCWRKCLRMFLQSQEKQIIQYSLSKTRLLRKALIMQLKLK